MSRHTVPAFPQDGYVDHSKDDQPTVTGPFPGLSKRELFAAMAMQGLIATQPDHWDVSDAERTCRIATLSLQAVEHADALLAELEKKQ